MKKHNQVYSLKICRIMVLVTVVFFLSNPVTIFEWKLSTTSAYSGVLDEDKLAQLMKFGLKLEDTELSIAEQAWRIVQPDASYSFKSMEKDEDNITGCTLWVFKWKTVDNNFAEVQIEEQKNNLLYFIDTAKYPNVNAQSKWLVSESSAIIANPKVFRNICAVS